MLKLLKSITRMLKSRDIETVYQWSCRCGGEMTAYKVDFLCRSELMMVPVGAC